MAKVTIKAECLTQSNNKNGSNATFIVEDKSKPPIVGAPGTAPRLPARRTVVVNFDDNTAKQFETGKQYTITIE
jgi:hypothetical protein